MISVITQLVLQFDIINNNVDSDNLITQSLLFCHHVFKKCFSCLKTLKIVQVVIYQSLKGGDMGDDNSGPRLGRRFWLCRVAADSQQLDW